MSTPRRLSDITLGQWVEFYNLYGKEHSRRYNEVMAMTEQQERDDHYMLYDVDVALETYSFYSGIPVKELEPRIKEIYIEQNEAFSVLKTEENELEYNGVYEWNGDRWQIQPLYKYTGDKLTADQFEIVQDLALILSDMQDGNYDSFFYLCASYFRKVNEKYDPDFGVLGNGRAMLMKSLPLVHAMRVKKYLQNYLKLYEAIKQQ